MTAVHPSRTDVRECRLYRFWVTHPLTGQVVLGYIGETGRQPFERLLEHLATQPWFDTVVRWEVDDRVFYGKNAVLRAEAAAIRDERPLYNVKGNERNGGRITPPAAIRQRRARDAQKGAARWVHPDDRGQRRTAGPSLEPVVFRREWKPWQKTVVAWFCGWLTVTVAGWVGLVYQWDFVAWWHPPAISAGTPPVVVAVAAWLIGRDKPKKRKRGRRR